MRCGVSVSGPHHQRQSRQCGLSAHQHLRQGRQKRRRGRDRQRRRQERDGQGSPRRHERRRSMERQRQRRLLGHLGSRASRLIRSPSQSARLMPGLDRKSTRLNSSHEWISYAVFCLKKKKKKYTIIILKKKKKQNTIDT